jgi:membrane fusion protein (multidrug efflux system)
VTHDWNCSPSIAIETFFAARSDCRQDRRLIAECSADLVAFDRASPTLSSSTPHRAREGTVVDGSSGNRGMATKVRVLGIGALVVAACAAIGFYIYHDRYGRYFEDTNDATIQADQVAISSKLSGYVSAVPVDDNQHVGAGSLLAEIDPLDYRTKLAMADADIASSVAAENAIKASQDEARAGVTEALAKLKAAGANLAYAQREVVRYGPLAATGAEPATMLSQLESNRDRASAEFASVRASLEQAQKRVTSIGAQTAQNAAQAEAARVKRQAAANDLTATRLIAPVAGRIASRNVRVGQFVQPGTRLMTVVPEEIYVVANFKETQMGLMRPGLPAKIYVDALPGITFTGSVTSVTPGTGSNFSMIPPQNATGNFTKIVQRVPVRIRIDAGPTARRVLMPGLSLEVEVDTRTARNVLDAIRDEQERGRK